MARPPVILTCAITGAIHTPTMSDALPWRSEDIAAQAIEAARAGAAVLHLHARHPETGAPSIDPEHFTDFLAAIRAETDAVVNISTGGSLTSTIDERLAPALAHRPEMCSLNMGSLNFALHPLAKRHSEWKFDWERPYLEASEGFIFRNTFADIRAVAETMGPEGVRFEHECYDVGHLYNLAHCMDAGLFEPPVFVQFVMGVLGGIAAETDNLVFMLRTADRLFGGGYLWSVIGAGAAQMPMVAAAVSMGGNVRVGLEDSLTIARGRLASSNAEQVAKARRIVEELGHELATPDQARERLGLRRRDTSAA